MIQPVNTTMPQAYQQGMYMPQQMPMYQQAPYFQPAQNNAVKIDIINPQAGTQTPYSPYAMPTVPQYAMPQASTYAPNVQYPIPLPVTTPQFQPQPQTLPAPIQMPVQPQVQTPAQAPVQAVATEPAPVVVPAPVVIPQPVINNQPQVINAPQVAMPEPPKAQQVEEAPAPAPAPAPTTTPTTTTAQTATPVEQAKTQEAPQVEAPATTPINVDLNQIVSKLNSTNLEEQLAAIENVAETAQSESPAAAQLLDTQIMDALGNIIKKDTTQMQGPTPEQLELKQKLIAGEKLTPEQTASATKISEMEAAERNKQFALYTIAILQKRLSSEVEKAQGTKLEMKDLPMIDDVVKVAKADANPMLRASALAALSYIAKPEYKPLLKIMFEQSQQDADPNVKAVATEALSKLSQI